MKKTRLGKLKSNRRKERKQKRKKVRKKVLIIFIILIACFVLYAMLIEPTMLFVREEKIVTDKISNSMHGLKIVQFTDVHYGTYYKKGNLNKLIKKINDLSPDIIIFNGDLVDENYVLNKDDINYITEQFTKLHATLGKYAVYGNHDVDVLSYNNIMYDSGFTLLKNSYEYVYSNDEIPIFIYGVDDILYGDPDVSFDVSDDIYKIVVVHEPDYIDKLDTTKIDLVLAGHSHNKQVKIPIISNFVLPEGAKKYYDYYYKVNDTDLYISNGVGCGLFKMRFLSPPSINLFRLTKKK